MRALAMGVPLRKASTLEICQFTLLQSITLFTYSFSFCLRHPSQEVLIHSKHKKHPTRFYAEGEEGGYDVLFLLGGTFRYIWMWFDKSLRHFVSITRLMLNNLNSKNLQKGKKIKKKLKTKQIIGLIKPSKRKRAIHTT